MSEIKGTPGPWRVSLDGAEVTADPLGILTSSGRICHIDDAFKQASEVGANRNLIAAAPELLEALRLCFDHCRLYYPEVEHNNVGKAVRAAIAKAEGQS
ncbi:hypothetical protein PQR71_41530 [Paraburkholderia fungorum]|uniref:hypothetical protein n=1 Tax=Paraburkholderia fungorum TaxID=134537 RepID=UPI0038BADC21